MVVKLAIYGGTCEVVTFFNKFANYHFLRHVYDGSLG